MQDKINTKGESLCTISVIGYSGSTAEHVHVGKSCLIHRFLSRTPYCEDHLSIVSRSEFDGEIVGGSHWLYWGESDCYMSENTRSRIQVIEQCEFLDDLLFSPISTQMPYIDRCLVRELVVPNRKLAYVCKNQLGDESSFPRSYINVGSVRISVFMCVYDITLEGSSAFHQAAFLQKVLKDLSRTDTPLVLVTSKHDCDWSTITRSLLELALNDVKKRWLKRRFCLVETSSRLNINVEKAFHNAVCLASGGTPLRLKLHKPHNSIMDQRMRSLSVRLRRPLHLHYREYKSDADQFVSVPSSIKTIMNEASLSYRAAYMTQIRNLDNKCMNSTSYPKQAITHGFSGDSVVCNFSGTLLTNAPVHAIPMQHFSQHARPAPQPGLHMPHLDEVSSTLPTPPPLLLPDPLSSGTFDPVSAPSFFGAHSGDETASSLAAVLADSATTYPLTRIYLYGPDDLVNVVMWTLRYACPLDRFRATDGSLHRVWILPGSGIGTEKRSPSSVVSESDNSAEPSTTGTTSMAALVPTDRKVFGTSPLSAFSVPAVGVVEDGPESNYSGVETVKSTHSSDPASRSTQSTDLGETNASCGPPCAQSTVQFSLRILVYDTAAQLREFDRYYNDYGGGATPCHLPTNDNEQPGTLSTMFSALLCWSSSRDEALLKESIARGALLASRLNIRLLSSDDTCVQNLLSHLLSLTCQVDSSQSNNGMPKSTMRPVCSFDWTSFSPYNCLPAIHYLLEPHHEDLVSPTEQPIPTRIVPLVALVEVVNRTVQPAESVTKPSTRNPVRRLPFLSPTVTAPTAVKLEQNRTDVPVHFSAARFLPFDELSTFLRYHPSESPHALIIHYLAASWSEIQTALRDHLETVLSQSVPDSPYSCSELGQTRACSVLLVGLHNPTRLDQFQAASIGLQNGMHCLQELAIMYNCSFRVLNPVQLITSDDTDPLSSLPNGVTPYSVASLETPWSQFNLMFLSLSVTNPAEQQLHRRALSGDANIFSQFSGGLENEYSIMTSCSHNVFKSSYNEQTSQTPVFNSTYPVNQSSSNNRVLGHSEQPLSLNSGNLTAFSLHGRHPLTGSNLVELPWLPLSPTRVWSSSPPLLSCAVRSKHRTNLPNENVQSLPPWVVASSVEGRRLGVSQASPLRTVETVANTTANSNDLTSSVEEYYAELPKIAQNDVRELERCSRRLNRPKRPRPRTTSTNSRSSSSPPSPPLVQSSSSCSIPVLDPSSTLVVNKMSNLVSNPLPTVENDPILRLSEVDLLDKESAIYAEVNDALINESGLRDSVSPSPTQAGLPGIDFQLDQYDTPYADCYRSCVMGPISDRFLPSSNVTHSTHLSVCTEANPENTLLVPETVRFEKPSFNHHPFVSRPLPTIIDLEPSPSITCLSCQNYSSPPTSSVCDSDLNSAPASPSNPNSHAFNLAQSEPHTSLAVNGKPPNHEHPENRTCLDHNADSNNHLKPNRPYFSTLNNLSAAIRRHGVWFRHSISLHARKKKS